MSPVFPEYSRAEIAKGKMKAKEVAPSKKKTVIPSADVGNSSQSGNANLALIALAGGPKVQ